MVQLLERRTQLTELEAARRAAGFGHGSVVTVAGDAGSGKSALVHQFASDAEDSARVLWGRCEDLALPRPLGPLRDMFPDVAGSVLAEGGRDAAHSWMTKYLHRLVAELSAPPSPAVIVIEDAQWADDATLEAIRFLGRRVQRMPAMVVVTYRCDEVAADHPLSQTLEKVPENALRSVRLDPLSREAVAELAGHRNPAALHRLTGGIPFYVHEVLANTDGQAPESLQEALLVRMLTLGATGYLTAELASVVPGKAERWLLADCGVARGLDEAVRAGVLEADDEHTWFPHELGRRAAEDSLPAYRRREIHARVLVALEQHDVDPARLFHHALRAENAPAVARYAPVAADRAAALNCHRDAAGFLEHALEHADHYADHDLAALVEFYGRECERSGALDWAREALVQATEMYEALGDPDGLGRSLRRLSSVEWSVGEGESARQAAAEAVAVLEGRPPGIEMVYSFAEVARLALTDCRTDEAIEWGARAVKLAAELGRPAAACHPAVTVGSARWLRDPHDSQPLAEALRHALTHGNALAAARAYSNLASGHVRQMNYEVARRFIDDGLAYAREHDLVGVAEFLTAVRAGWYLDQGEWPLAERDANDVAAKGTELAGRTYALGVLIVLYARRGDPSVDDAVGEAAELVEYTGDAQAKLHIGIARAEAAWLRGDTLETRRLASPLLALAHERGASRFIGAVAFWLHRAGALDQPPADAAEPYRLQMTGQWRESARRWDELRRPYERADALAESPEPAPLLEALSVLDQLGAAPRASMVRRRLAQMGVAEVPRPGRTFGD